MICGVAATIFGGILIGSSSSIARLTRMFFLSKLELDQALAETCESHQREKLLSQELAEQARRDALTGVFNRRHLVEQLDNQVSYFLRTKQPFSIVMADIDHFKCINDTYGHDVGDVVLKGSTHALSQELRDIDIFGRWGGEEFLCILPNTNSDGAQLCAERLRERLAATIFSENVHNLNVTASFGVSTSRDNDCPDDIVKRCDLALYRAKSEGRDRIVVGDRNHQ